MCLVFKGLKGGVREKKVKSLMNIKNLKVETLMKIDQWKARKADFEDYAEELIPGMKVQLDAVRELEEASRPTMFRAQREVIGHF